MSGTPPQSPAIDPASAGPASTAGRDAAEALGAPPPAHVAYDFLFITGAPKSGTTWLGWMLHAHPRVRVYGEACFFGAAGSAETWLNAEAFRAWIGQHTVRKLMGRVEGVDFEAAAVRAMVEAMVRLRWRPGPGVRVLGDRSPVAYDRGADALSRVFPDARVIDVVRDGRDVCVSNMFQNLRLGKADGFFDSPADAARARAAHLEGSGDPGTPLLTPAAVRFFAARWRESVRGGQRLGELFGDRCRSVRYERLLEGPEAHLGGLYRWLGVEDDAPLVARAVAENRFEEKSGGRAPGQADPSAFVRKGIAGDWKNYFTPADASAFREAAGDLLVELGYETSNAW